MTDPKRLARMTGLLYIVLIATAAFAQGYVSERLHVPGDAGATAANILANKGLIRAGYAFYMIEMACDMTIAALLYVLLRPVSRAVALVGTVLSLAGSVFKTFARVFFLLPLFVLGGTTALVAFSPEQREALALLALRINDQGAAMAMVFFGFAALVKGYLILRSGFWPRALGVLSILGGLGWLSYLYAPLLSRVFPYVMGIGLLGLAVHVFWLLVFGVDEKRWRERAEAARAG